MAIRKMLVVEDDPSVQELLKVNMEKVGWEVQLADSGEAALLVVSKLDPDLILLDVMLSGLGGIEVCRQLRRYPQTRETPVIMLSALSQEKDIVAGLRDGGADDYVTKPFNLNVLHAKIDALLRRSIKESRETKPETLRIHNLCIDPLRYAVEVDGEKVELTRNDFRALLMLARQPGRVFSRTDIIVGVHGKNPSISERSVDVQIVGLRRKIDPRGKLIETVRGVGYRMKEE
ncbi:MAG: response regulator transcription factor [Verrucomicrobiota bacterium]|nr:response regulator transcription factor [Verrucomicrobiota bacterium]